MPPVAFDEVPRTIRIPGVYIEVASGRSGGAVVPFRSLVIGQRLAGGAVAEGVLRPMASQADAARDFGAGSMLEQMVGAFRRQNRLGELWAVALDDAATGVDTTVTVTVTAGATAAGAVVLYIAGRRVAVGIAGVATVTEVATAIHDAVTTLGALLPVTSGVAAGVVTLTARNAGTGSDLDVRLNYGSTDVLPAGVAITIAVMTPGSIDPDIDDALDVVAEEKFDVIAHPYNPAATMTTLEGELDTRWGPLLQVDGFAVTGLRGTAAAATTYGNARNSPHSAVMDISTSPTPIPVWAGAIAGAVAGSAEIDPARPLQTLELKGVLAPPADDVRSATEANTLLGDGIATHTVDADGTVRIQRLVTTYQTLSGVPDTAYMDAETPLTISFLRSDLRQTFQTKFPRWKLGDDGTRVDPGQLLMTPSIARQEVLAKFGEWERRALVEDALAFEEGLIASRNIDDPDRLDLGLSPDLINQLRVVAGRLQFLR